MNKVNNLNEQIHNEIDLLRNKLNAIHKIKVLAPLLQHRIDEAEAKLEVIECIPDDFAEELAPKLIILQQEANQYLESKLSFIPDIDVRQATTDLNTSGSSTAYVYSIMSTLDSEPIIHNDDPWVTNVKFSIDKITNELDRRKKITLRLAQIYKDLGEMFTKACKNFDECKAGILEINHGAMQLRNVLNQLWGNLLELTRSKFPNETGKLSNLQLKKSNDRNLLAEMLAENDYAKMKLSQSLDLVDSLFRQLSDTQFGKNPLNIDLEKLKSIYNQWLMVIDDITSILWN